VIFNRTWEHWYNKQAPREFLFWKCYCQLHKLPVQQFDALFMETVKKKKRANVHLSSCLTHLCNFYCNYHSITTSWKGCFWDSGTHGVCQMLTAFMCRTGKILDQCNGTNVGASPLTLSRKDLV
jgi:hypothetical protein